MDLTGATAENMVGFFKTKHIFFVCCRNTSELWNVVWNGKAEAPDFNNK